MVSMSRRPVLALGVCAVLLTACSSGSTQSGDPVLPQRAAASVTVRTQAVPGLGTVLTDGTGHVLYMFPPDAKRTVTCTGPCAGTWPPLAIASGHTPRAAGGARATKLGTLPDPNTGARVVTYAGQPLYRYAGDVSPGVANGQALNLDGGPWYVLNVAGAPLTTALGSR
jgi:predicted lipoprotein with Yx(FWY)xxD motif